jgi:very-short-patch-repair endonuclease
MSQLSETFYFHIKDLGIPEPEKEYRFIAEKLGKGKGLRERLLKANLKDWRFDFAWPDQKIAVEIEGGIYVKGGHVRGKIYTDNCRKYNEAGLRGWMVLRFTTDLIESGEAFSTLEKVFCKT